MISLQAYRLTFLKGSGLVLIAVDTAQDRICVQYLYLYLYLMLL
jgi:hypothetical protein